MNFLSLALILVCSSCGCLAATNRSTVWFLADSLVYSTSKGYQPCPRLASSPNTTLLSTSYYRITSGASADALFFLTLGGNTATGDGTTYTLKSLQLIFTYGDSATPNVAFNLPSFTLMSSSTGNYGNLITNVITPGTYTSASGAAWLHVRPVYWYGYTSSGSSAGTATDSTPVGASILITDYRSLSTFLITQYEDGDDTAATNLYNHLYSVIVRTPTYLLTSSSDTLVAGCTARSAGNGGQVTASLSPNTFTCASTVTASTSDTSISGSTALCTDTGLPDGVALSIAGISTLRTQDNTLFGAAAGSKFAIAANFGVLAALSTFIFSLLN